MPRSIEALILIELSILILYSIDNFIDIELIL